MSARHPPRDRPVRLHDADHHHHHPDQNGVPSPSMPPAPLSPLQRLAAANEQTWLLIGQVAEQMGDLDHGQTAYENALRHNPTSLPGLTQVAAIARIKENYPKAVEYFQRALNLQEDNGEVWSALGHCYLMQDDLQKAYSAYQQALYLLPNPKEDPKLWYGIGILYDRYGSLDHAEEAFSSVLRMEKELDFDKVNEILFRLGIIYKQQLKYDESLQCFERILRNPPSPLAHADIWFQIGHVYEQMKDPIQARNAYERVISDNPTHAKVLQQLGWLHHQDESPFQNQDIAIQYLTQSLEADPSDAQSWYLLGRAYMAGQKYNKAYEAYQQAVYRDGRNPTFWCSIGVLYFQINQFRDALDAYSRAIRINPYISEVWFDLGSLYESCNNQISDAIDAYARASELDRNNMVVLERLELLKKAQLTGAQIPAAPGPQDVHPTAYANPVVSPPGLSGPPLMLQGQNARGTYSDPRGPAHEGSMAPPPPAPFRGGPPPPVVLNEERSSHPILAPMDVDRPVHADHPPPPSRRDAPSRGPLGQNILLHQPSPRERSPSLPEPRHAMQNESYFTRGSRPGSASVSPNHARNRSPSGSYQNYSSSRQPSAPGPPSSVLQHSPRPPASRESGRRDDWDRRPPPPPLNDHRDWERRPPPPPSYVNHSPEVRMQSPPEPSPRSTHSSRSFWDAKAAPPGPLTSSAGGPPPLHQQQHSPPPPPEPMSRRYDPRLDGREEPDRGMHAPLPRHVASTSQQFPPGASQESNSRAPTPAMSDSGKRKKTQRLGLKEEPPMNGGDRSQKKKRQPTKRGKDEDMRSETPKPYPPTSDSGIRQPGRSYRPESPEATTSSAGSSASNKDSPTTAQPPSRVVDEDYDEGVVEALAGLKNPQPSKFNPPPPARHTMHRGSISAGQASPTLKRPHSPVAEELSDPQKRSRTENTTSGRRTPVPSTRPSPIPFRTQPISRSPESGRSSIQTSQTSAASPPPPPVPTLPPHPRPVGPSSISSLNGPALPPIATLSPGSEGTSPGGDRRQESRTPPSTNGKPRPSVSEGSRGSPPPQRTSHSP